MQCQKSVDRQNIIPEEQEPHRRDGQTMVRHLPDGFAGVAFQVQAEERPVVRMMICRMIFLIFASFFSPYA